MSTELTNFANNAGNDLRDSFTLLSGATSTVEGGEVTINYSGAHTLTTYGTFNGATSSLYVKPVGQSTFNVWKDLTSGNTATATVAGGLSVDLSQGDKVKAQLSGVGGSTSLTSTLTFNS